MSYYLKLMLFTLCFGFSNFVSAVEPSNLKKDCDEKEAPPALLSNLDQSIELILAKSSTVQNPAEALSLLATMPSTVSAQEIIDNFGVSTNVAYTLLDLNSERASFQEPVLVGDSETFEQIPNVDPCVIEKLLKNHKFMKNLKIYNDKEYLEQFRKDREQLRQNLKQFRQDGESSSTFKPFGERSGKGTFKPFRERSGDIPTLEYDGGVF